MYNFDPKHGGTPPPPKIMFESFFSVSGDEVEGPNGECPEVSSLFYKIYIKINPKKLTAVHSYLFLMGLEGPP